MNSQGRKTLGGVDLKDFALEGGGGNPTGCYGLL